MFFHYVQPYVLKSARMEAHVQLQIAAPALVDGLGTIAVKVCDSIRYMTVYIITRSGKQGAFYFCGASCNVKRNLTKYYNIIRIMN